MTERQPIRITRRPETPEQIQRREQLRWQQEMRNTFLVPIYVTWTSDLPHLEAQAALQGVVDAVHASGQDRQVVSFGSQRYGTGDFSSPEWYVDEAYRTQSLRRNAGYGEQIVASELSSLLIREPWQASPHWDVFILNKDLNDHGRSGYLNFVFGGTDTLNRISVQSITRLIHEVPQEGTRLAMVRRLLRHEVGHMFGLPRSTRTRNITDSLGPHCTDVCTMRQGLSIEAWKEQTLQEERMGVHFCRDCRYELAERKDLYLPVR